MGNFGYPLYCFHILHMTRLLKMFMLNKKRQRGKKKKQEDLKSHLVLKIVAFFLL